MSSSSLEHSSTPKKERQHSLQNETVSLDDVSSRTNLLEQRIKAVEAVNRVLRDEFAALQDELQAFQRQAGKSRRDRDALLDIVDSIKVSNGIISKMVTRIRDAENMLYSQKLAFNSVLDQTSHFEMVLYDHQEDMKVQKHNYQQSIAELWNEVRDIHRQRGLIDQTILNLLKEVGRSRDKEKQQDSEINLIERQVKHSFHNLENDLKLSSIHRQPEIQYAEWSTAQIKPTSENRLPELQNHLPYIKNNIATLDSERRTLEQDMVSRFNDLNTALIRQDHKREEELNKLYRQQQEINHLTETEHINLHSKIAHVAEAAKQTLIEKELQLREEAQNKFFELEESIQRVNAKRIEFEKKLWQENENKWASFQHSNENVKDHTQTQRIKEDEWNKTVNDDNMLERSLVSKHKWLEKVLTAEILKRNEQGTQFSTKFDDLHDNMSSSITALQKSIGYLQESIGKEIEKTEAINRDFESVQKTMNTLLTDVHQIKTEEIPAIKENVDHCLKEIELLHDCIFKLQCLNVPEAKCFIKKPVVPEVKEINTWGLYQATRWMQWKKNMKDLRKSRKSRNSMEMIPEIS